MSSKGWFNLEAVGGTIPETQFFEGDSAFSSLGLTRTQRLYGFAAWYVVARSLLRNLYFRFLFFLLSVGLGSFCCSMLSGHLILLSDAVILFVAVMLLEWSSVSSEP